jgi:hypothetical protein
MSSPASVIDPLDQPVWGLEGIAKILNMSPKRCEHLLRGGAIDADKFVGRWVSTPRRLLAQFAGKASVEAAASRLAEQHGPDVREMAG